MTHFSSVSNVQFGCKRLLSTLHADEISRMHQAPREERERHAERASRLREMMSHLDILRMVGSLTR